MKKASLALLFAVVASGCGVPSYVTSNDAPVNLFITGITPTPIKSDVVQAGVVTNDVATVSLAVRPKNPSVTVPQVPMAVLMERYEIHYFRSDGRNTEGVDVPYSITGALNGGIDAASSGSTAFPIEVVRVQAKLEPPLRNLRGAVSESLGGSALVITMFAQITVHGRTIAGQAVQATASAQIDFADFAS